MAEHITHREYLDQVFPAWWKDFTATLKEGPMAKSKDPLLPPFDYDELSLDELEHTAAKTAVQLIEALHDINSLHSRVSQLQMSNRNHQARYEQAKLEVTQSAEQLSDAQRTMNEMYDILAILVEKAGGRVEIEETAARENHVLRWWQDPRTGSFILRSGHE